MLSSGLASLSTRWQSKTCYSVLNYLGRQNESLSNQICNFNCLLKKIVKGYWQFFGKKQHNPVFVSYERRLRKCPHFATVRPQTLIYLIGISYARPTQSENDFKTTFIFNKSGVKKCLVPFLLVHPTLSEVAQ